jgi:hypothetical protein
MNRKTFSRHLIDTLILIGLHFMLLSCASGREFWNYVVEEPVNKPLLKNVNDTPIAAGGASPQFVRVNFNDGVTTTEVQIPILSSGQQIVIDHKGQPNEKNIGLIPLPPTAADKGLEESYLRDGGTINASSNQVSIVKTQAEIRKLAKQGNFALALEYATLLLNRYPNHVETLRSQGALLLKMGESKAALEAYQKAQDLQPSQRVQKQIEALERAEEQKP